MRALPDFATTAVAAVGRCAAPTLQGSPNDLDRADAHQFQALAQVRPVYMCGLAQDAVVCLKKHMPPCSHTVPTLLLQAALEPVAFTRQLAAMAAAGGGSSKQAAAAGELPADATAIRNILKTMGVEAHEPRVMNMLLDFMYSYVSGVLSDASAFAEQVGIS